MDIRNQDRVFRRLQRKVYPVIDDREVIEVYDLDPRTNSKAKEIDFQQDEEGVHFISNQNGI